MNSIRIIKCIENLGIYVNKETIHEEDFSNLIEDSLTFITFIIELENEFNIEVPDNFLLMENFKNLNQIENIIEILQNKDLD